MAKKHSPSISISGRAFAILRAYCDEQNITPGQFVEAHVDHVAPLVRTLQDVARERTEEVNAPFCASCTKVRPPYMLVDDRAHCVVCREEHPRSGRYSFEGGRPDARGQSANVRIVGEGNRTTHGRR